MRAMKRLGSTFLRTLDPREFGRCLSCGYDITGVSASICPECGASIHEWKWWRTRATKWIVVIGVVAPLALSGALLLIPSGKHGFMLPSGTGADSLSVVLTYVFGHWAAFHAWLVAPIMILSWTQWRIYRRMNKADKRRYGMQLRVPTFVLVTSSVLLIYMASRVWARVAMGVGAP